ncbi:hypothetical protein SLA2020_205040 [Shorea laevis]
MKMVSSPENEEKRECSRSKAEEQEEDDDEALSLSDLPVNLIEDENQLRESKEGESQAIKTEEDFDFGSWGGTISAEPAEMCAADEVFFQGQILPLRLSVSSDSGLTGFRNDSRIPSRCISRSESMDHGTVSRLTSLSSRSSSSGSRISSSSSSSITNTITRNPNSKPNRISNNFHTHPSPKPQIIVSKSRPSNVGSRSQRSSVWDFFRLGLVRAPEIELQDLKIRNTQNKATRTSVSRNSSCSSSNSSSDTKIKNQNPRRGGFFNGCKCSVSAVETVPLNNIVVIKTSKNEKPPATAMERKGFPELKMKKKMKEKEREKEKQDGKQALSRHRTFEWLKELSNSHVGYGDEC